MDIDEAIKGRHSVRQYLPKKIEGEVLDSLRDKISEINAESGLRFILVMDEPTAFGGFMTRLTKFKNAVNYIAVIGKESDDIYYRTGYYGEKLVLYAQTLGLNTCWAMLCSKKACKQYISDGEIMTIGISIGYGENQGVPHRSKATSQVAELVDAPQWFYKGVEAALLAPTGMNKQDFRFERDGNKVRLTGPKSKLAMIDLGIVRYHFECGAGQDNFEWAD